MVGNLPRTILSVIVAITLSVVAMPQMSGPETADGSDWSIETVDPDFGHVPSIALDSNDSPHISYFDHTNYNLRYAYWNGSAWYLMTVDSDAQVGVDNSIAVDSSDNPHISYFGAGYLRYARWNGSAWDIQIVVYYGKKTSLALDSDDNPHISFCSEDWIKYANWNGSAWNIEIIDVSSCLGGWTSIALDSDDNPHIGYHYSLGDDLRHANWNGTAWNIETVDSVGDVGSWTSIALDSDDNPHMSYREQIDWTDGNLKHAYWNGSAWSIETVDSCGWFGDTSIALDSNDDPHLSYYDSAQGNLKYARWTGSMWDFEIVDSAGVVGMDNSIALDGKDNPHIGYFNNTGGLTGSLKYATKAEPKPARSIALDIDPDTLNLKSKGKWITAYFTTEDSEADEIDASFLLLNDAVPPEWWVIQSEHVLMVKFDRLAVQAILPVSNSVDIKITGKWEDGKGFEVHDTIRVINPGQ
jgi:hypothetical protein